MTNQTTGQGDGLHAYHTLTLVTYFTITDIYIYIYIYIIYLQGRNAVYLSQILDAVVGQNKVLKFCQFCLQILPHRRNVVIVKENLYMYRCALGKENALDAIQM